MYQGWREGWFTNDHWIAFAADSVAPTADGAVTAAEAGGGKGEGERAAVGVVELKKLGPEK